MNADTYAIQARWVNIANRNIEPVELGIAQGRVAYMQPLQGLDMANAEVLPYLVPGFVDAHVHIESSMLVPAEFARMAVVHGTVATVSDPHEIANVCGIDGVNYMIENGKKVPFKFFFGAPSCVPATSFETAGDSINADQVDTLLQREEILYLSEMMNFPGVLHADVEVMAKIATAHNYGKPVDGHAPGLRGTQLQQYIDAGISTDHECFTYEEALDKLQRGMKVIIREGSAAKNFDALAPLLHHWYGQMMFCSDDKHPDSLEVSHINALCARAVALGVDVFKVLQVACINPVQHYGLPVGQLEVGQPADFVLLHNLKDFSVKATYINGQQVAEEGKSLIPRQVPDEAKAMNRFVSYHIAPEQISYSRAHTAAAVPVIGALDGQLITNRLDWSPAGQELAIKADVEADRLKIVVVNRYQKAPPAVAFIHGFGLQDGALASSVAHDSHNIVAVGTSDAAICRAVNAVMDAQGGISAAHSEAVHTLALPVAGLMTAQDGYEVSKAYTALDQLVKQQLGSTLQSPFMTLSFMALLVIPHLKLSDLGLFDGDSFKFVK